MSSASDEFKGMVTTVIGLSAIVFGAIGALFLVGLMIERFADSASSDDRKTCAPFESIGHLRDHNTVRSVCRETDGGFQVRDVKP